MAIYFKILTFGLYILYILNMYVKFYFNRILFIIWSIKLLLFIILYFKILKFKHLIDDIAINLQFFRNFAGMWDIKRKCYLMVDLSKFTSDKKLLSKIVAISYNYICSQLYPKYITLNSRNLKFYYQKFQ